MKDRGELTEQVNEPLHADSEPGAAGHTIRPHGLAASPSKTIRKGDVRKIVGASDGGGLVVAVTVAMLLGVACGLWLSARLASSAMDASALPAQSRPALNEDESEPDVTKPAPDDSEDATAVVNNPSPPTVARESDDEKEPVSTPPRAPAENVREAESKAARPSASEAEAPSETASRKNAPSKGAASPCPLYASASALTVRGGGEAALVLGSHGQQGRLAVTTPNWADIAVFSEGNAGGNRGWMRYSVRSVSKRAGAFSVRVNGPCGSLTIPVKVVRP